MLTGRHVGFSGTQEGLTTEQIFAIDELLSDNLTTQTAHSGDCIGADAQFYRLAKLQGLWSVGHPPINSSKRAFCDFDEEMTPGEYLDRNRTIVKASDWMIFGPKGYKEELRSGTWSTKRFTCEQGKNGFIVWPDGKIIDI